MRTNKTKLTIFCATLALFAASCEKQDDYPMVSPLHTDTTNEYLHICYSIDGGMYQPVRCTPAELDAILNDLLTLVRNGHSISIFNSNTFRNANTKEVVVKHFKTKEEAESWSISMIREGYNVTFEYDSTEGTYVVTAKK